MDSPRRPSAHAPSAEERAAATERRRALAEEQKADWDMNYLAGSAIAQELVKLRSKMGLLKLVIFKVTRC